MPTRRGGPGDGVAEQTGPVVAPPEEVPGDPDEALARIPLLAEIPRRLRRRLAREARVERLRAGRYLFHQGDPPETLAFVVSGRLRAVDERAQPPRTVGLLGEGAVAGELSILTGKPRSVGIRAQRDSDVILLPAEAFHRLLDDEPKVAVALARSLATQVQAIDDRIPATPMPTTFCVVPADPAADPQPVVDGLVRALGHRGRVGILRPEAAPAGEDGETRRAWAERLDQVEVASASTVVVAPDPWRERTWAAFATASADRTLAVVGPEAAPDAALGDLLAGADLVRCTGTTDGTARPGAPAPAPTLRAQHLLPEGPGWDRAVARMARRLTGRAVGVVFSGGGARGFAHLGVIAALEEAGVPVDRVGGTSAGAFAAALLAMGLDADGCEAATRAAFIDRNRFTDRAVPRIALLRGKRVTAMLEATFGDRRIEDLPRPLFACSADLATGELVVHRDGALGTAVGASMCIPGLTPPVQLDGRVLVDGGLLDNLPVDVMAADGEGPIIAVDVSRTFPTADDDPADPGAGDDAAGAAEDLDLGIGGILARSLVLGGQQRAEENRSRADLLITPAVADVGFFSFDRFDDAVAAGREAARAALASWSGPRHASPTLTG